MFTYGTLKEALCAYLVEGWQSHDPSLGGVCGLMDIRTVQEVQDFLTVPKERWARIMQDVAVASVNASTFCTKCGVAL
jgi:hypothetical protein